MFRKILAVPLAAVVIAMSLALAPTAGVPALLSLEVEEASAHPLTVTLNVPLIPVSVCTLEWNYVYKIVDWETSRYFPNAEPEPRWVVGPWPVYGWRWDQEEVCHTEWRRPTAPNPHYHVPETVCRWLVRAGGFSLGYFPTTRAARAFAAGTGVGAGEIDIQQRCHTEDIVVYLIPGPYD